MDNDKILDYVMNSPANTNPNVLKTMLNGSSGGSGMDPFKVTITGIYDESTGTSTYTCDKSYGEISDWWDGLLSGSEYKPCIIKTDGDTDRRTYYGRVTTCDGSNGTGGYLFIISDVDNINMFEQPPEYTRTIEGYSLVPNYEMDTDVVEPVRGFFAVEFQYDD